MAQRTEEFQAVVMAGGAGSKLYPLTEEIAKPLLPVANRPLLAFQLQLLERAGFASVIVVTAKPLQEQIAPFLGRYKGEIRIQVVVVDDFCGTADALRRVAHLLHTDFFVFSCDVITDVFIHYLADIHRKRNAAATVLLAEEIVHNGRHRPLKEDMGVHFVGLDDKKQRLLVFRAATDVEDRLRVSKAVLKANPSLTLHTTLRDVHVYLFSHWVLRVLEDHAAITSIQSELLPFLVRSQFATTTRKYVEANAEEKETRNRTRAPVAAMEPQGCFAFVSSAQSYCRRANTVDGYRQMNLELASLSVSDQTPWVPISTTNCVKETRQRCPASNIGGQGVVVGEGVTVGEKSSVKKAVVGNGCRIGNGVRISNSVFMHNVIVEDRCTIKDCVLSADVRVEQGTTLDGCHVGVGFQVKKKSQCREEDCVFTVYAGSHKGEALCRAREML